MSVSLLKKVKKKTSAEVQVEEECAGYTYMDTLTLRPPDGSLLDAVPRPRRAALPGGLPGWSRKPLNSKLPLMQGPDGPVEFTRGKLGENLWRSAPGSEFLVRDPRRLEYEPVHDSHLHNWLRRPRTLDILRAQDLITPSLRVKCNVQQYNDFRQLLYNVYRDALRAEANRRENIKLEKLMLKKAQLSAEKEAEKMKKIEYHNSKRLSNKNKLEMANMERLERCKKRLQRVIDRAARAEERKDIELARRKERMIEFDERIKLRVIAANNIERRNKIKAMKAWHKQDVEKKKQFEKRKNQHDLENKQKAEEKWKRKVAEQNKQIAKEEYLQKKREEEKQNYKQQYMKLMKKAWIRMEDELNYRKCRGTLDKVTYDKRKKSIKEIMHSVSEAYTSMKSLQALSQDEETLETLTDRIQQILREIRYDLEPYIVIAHAKTRLERQENVPIGVSGAIKYLLEQTIVEYTAKQLTKTLANTAKKVLTAIDEITTHPSVSIDSQSISIKRSSLSSTFPRKYSMVSTKTARISDVEVIPVYKATEELLVAVDELRKTKDRPPTPMPSIATFTEVLFKNPESEEFDEEFIREFPLLEQTKLILTINNISNKIYKMIPSRVRAVVESRSYDRISAFSNETNKIENFAEGKPVAKLCSLILFEDRMNDSVLTQIVDKIILNFMTDIQLTPSYLRLKIRQKV